MRGFAFAALLLAELSSAATRRDPCFEMLKQQVAHDFHCPIDEVFVWPSDAAPKDTVDAFGCGLRASYVARPWESGDGCSWDRPAPPWVDPNQAKNVLRFNVGAGAPTGLAGFSYERRLGSVFALEPGIGWGLSGVQLSLLFRVRNIPILGSPGFGASLAFGPDPEWLVRQKRNVIVWLDIEVVEHEFRFKSGFALSIGAGIVAPLAGDFAVCRSKCTAVESQSFIYPALRIGLGRWF